MGMWQIMVIQLYRPYTGDDQNPWVVRRSMHQLKDSWNRVGVQTFFLQSSENRLVGGIFRGSTSNQMGCPSFNPRKISAISWFTPFFWRSATPPPRERPVVLAMAHTHIFFFWQNVEIPLAPKFLFESYEASLCGSEIEMSLVMISQQIADCRWGQ